MRKVFLAATAFAAASFAQAQDNPRSVTAEEFLANGQRLVGRRVIIAGCSISRANAAYAFCSVPGRSGTIYLDGLTMNRASLAEAMKACASGALEPQCAAVVAGLVQKGGERPQIRGAFILWQAPARSAKWTSALLTGPYRRAAPE